MTGLCIDDFFDEHEASFFKLFIDVLSQMTIQKGTSTISGVEITTDMVINQIDRCMEANRDKSFALYTCQTIKDFIKGISLTEVKNHKRYMMACIWNSFSTYKVKASSEFLRTYEGP